MKKKSKKYVKKRLVNCIKIFLKKKKPESINMLVNNVESILKKEKKKCQNDTAFHK